MGIFSRPTPFKDQDYHALKKQAQDSGHPFIDSEFPPDDKAIFFSGSSMKEIVWRRPKDICENPQLFVEGVSAHDLNQGEMGNCWMVAACSCMASDKDIWRKVIPDHNEQEWDSEHPEKYGGIFRFRFWRYGEWVEVVVDDLLPTRNGKLVYVHSKQDNEFWSALLEKAYAKLYGSYEALDGGELAEGLEDFTGGVTEPIDLEEGGYAADEAKREELFKTMKKGAEHRALMAAAIPAKSKEEMEASTESGLVIGHAYGITAVKRIALSGTGLFGTFNREKIDMIRLRNPWGGHEWKGAFSDGSPEWDKMSKGDRESVGLTFEDDGEFWMSFEDFCQYFKILSLCRVVNTSFFSIQKTWDEALTHGKWCSPDRQGGCMNNKETFLKNPQFRFDVEPDEDECLFALTQKSGRSQNESKHTIGFTIMKVEHNRKYRIHKTQEVICSSDFKNSRSIFLRRTLPRGRYVIVMCTFDPGQIGEFLFRLYTDTDNNAKMLELDQPERSTFDCFSCIPYFRYPQVMTQIKVLRAMGLERKDTLGGADPYVYITCEGRKHYRSPSAKDTTSPEWNFSTLIYRKRPMQKPIVIQIWNSNVVKDDFMGQVELPATSEESGKIYEKDLTDRSNKSERRPGKIWIQISNSINFTSF